ncbi:MAG: hypothetical protein WKF34_13710 [Pyrinomonadaceae bacterium]
MLATNQVLNGGRYRVISVSGQDESGGWYNAYDTVGERNVTLRERVGRGAKVITAGQLEALNSEFAIGARALSSIKHESLIGVQDYFSDIDRQYLVLDPIMGDDLSQLAADQPQPLTHAIAWAEQLLNALDNLHRQAPPIIHHEIRPSNIRITANRYAKLLTGGVPVTRASDTVTLIPGQNSCNPAYHYKPLEQLWEGLDPASQRVILNSYDERSAGVLLRPLDARTDLYALAATLYHVLTGVIPVDALERSIALLEGKPDPLAPSAELVQGMPDDVSDVLSKALSVRREQRYNSALEMLQSLRSAVLRAEQHKLSIAPGFAMEPQEESDTELDELEAEQARLDQETKKLEARRSELQAERTQREQQAEAERRRVELERLAAEAEAERQRTAEKLAALETEREMERAEEERLEREAEGERQRAEERLAELKAERERHHAERMRLEEETRLELERSQKKIIELSGFHLELDKIDETPAVDEADQPWPSTIDEKANGEPVLSLYEEKPKSNRGVALAAGAGLLLVAAAFGIWQMTERAASLPEPAASAHTDVAPAIVSEPSPLMEQAAAVESSEAMPVEATVETTVAGSRSRPQISSFEPKQKRPTQIGPKVPPVRKKITVDDLINDN